MSHNMGDYMEETLRQIIRCLVQEPNVRGIVIDELKLHSPEFETDFTFFSEEMEGTFLLRVVMDKGVCKFYLPDEREVRIETWQAKALYLFYLLCPVGVSNEELINYEEYIKRIYEVIYIGKCDPVRKEYIEILVRQKERLNNATLKIRKALKAVIPDESLLRAYLINGRRGGPRRVLLPKDKIRFENCKEIEYIRWEMELKFMQKNSL